MTHGVPANAGAVPKTRDRRCPVLIGRTAELDRLVRGVRSAQAGRGGTLLLSGPAGIGKSRLVREVAERAREDGVRVLELESHRAFRPLQEALLGGLRGAPDPDSPQLTGFKPALGKIVPQWAHLADQALAAGESVVALARDAAKLADLGPVERLLTLSADVRDENAVQQAVEQAVTRFGRIDVLANNAGYGVFGAVEEATDAQARALFDTNVFGVLNVLRATLPVLRAQRSGHILQGSSIFGQTAAPGFGMLAASKYAVEGLSDALALEVAPLGIKVTLVQPGPTATAFGANVDPAQGAHADYDATVRAPQGDTPASAADKVAEGIRAAVADPNPPRRLALGVVSATGMRDALTARLADLDTWAGVSEKVDA